MKPLSTHQALRLSCWIDAIESKIRVRRRCADKAMAREKKAQASYWATWVTKAEGVVSRLKNKLTNQENN